MAKRDFKNKFPRDENGRVIFKKSEKYFKDSIRCFDEGLDYFKSDLSEIYKEISKEILDVDKRIINKIITAFGKKAKERISAGFTVEIPSIGTVFVYHRPAGRILKTGRAGERKVPAKLGLNFKPNCSIISEFAKKNKKLKYEFHGITPEEAEKRKQYWIAQLKERAKKRREEALKGE